MSIPVPALLAAIVLLLWPAGRLCAIWANGRHGLLRAPSASSNGVAAKLQSTTLATVVLARNFLLFGLILAALLLAKALVQRVYGSGMPSIFGAVPLSAFFDLAMLVQFAVFVFQSALDSKMVLAKSDPAVRKTMSQIIVTIPNRLFAELAVYASTVAMSALIFVVGAGFFAFR